MSKDKSNLTVEEQEACARRAKRIRKAGKAGGVEAGKKQFLVELNDILGGAL